MFGHTLRELEEGSFLTTMGLGYFKLSSGRDDDVFVIYETRIYYWFSYFNNRECASTRFIL